MTRPALAAAACAVGLVVAAGAVVALGGPDDFAAGSTPPGPTTSPVPTTATPTPTVPSATTAPTVAKGPLTATDAEAAIPREDAELAAAELQVELGSVCEGATFDLVGATPVYASLQTVDDPLQYLDAVVVVYETVPTAATAYERIAEAIAACPPSRTATPAPPAPDERPVPIDIEGEVRADVVVAELPAVQWVQVQAADGTELRTAITVVQVENALVAISMDQDSETIGADELAAASIARAAVVVTALRAAA
jgi:hypothetical protein